MSKFLVRVGEAQIIHPRWYGRAYRDYLTCTDVFCPVPLNFIVGWARSAWYWLVRGLRPRLWERYLRAVRTTAYDAGYESGKRSVQREWDREKEEARKYVERVMRVVRDTEEREKGR